MIHLDTHIVIWLYQGFLAKLSQGARSLIETDSIAVSPMVTFELAILFELGRVSEGPDAVLSELRRTTGLIVAGERFDEAARAASHQRFAFTRDPFDRLIAAHAYVAGVPLLTKDERLREHLDFAVWP